MRTLPFTAILFLLMFSACTTTPVPPEAAAPHFTKEPALSLNVGKIEFADEYRSPGTPPNVEHLFDYTPADVFKTWVHDHIHPTGGQNTLQITISDASVVEAKLPKTKGLEGFFTVDQGSSYDGKLSVEMRIFKPGSAISEAEVSATTNHSSTLVENATLQQRDKLFYDLTLEMVNTIGSQLDHDMRQYFSTYIK